MAGERKSLEPHVFSRPAIISAAGCFIIISSPTLISTRMSLQVNLSSPEILQAYQAVIDAHGGVDWMMLTYEKGSNDLKVQGTGSDGLEELEEEFSDGRYDDIPHLIPSRTMLTRREYRIQYAFVRVKDPNVRPSPPMLSIPSHDLTTPQSGLSKFVQINWCGDGVPEVKKGLFHTHSSSVAKFFRNAHVVISARNEVRLSPSSYHPVR